TLQRGNAVRDALRYKRGREASEAACDAERRPIVDTQTKTPRSSRGVFRCRGSLTQRSTS
ncbi:DUF1534 domain-containing protein, partial [Pseudomonas syringae]|nr:DUF1534 domain-containing protein [Pseudomonas syringae]